ncbi:hypothetical protein [Novosphingobium sp.]|uniref:hypothetical protein n=1 Tax=Novosphingobium sp. TaxID=1874826 RepID=UPI003BA8AA75
MPRSLPLVAAIAALILPASMTNAAASTGPVAVAADTSHASESTSRAIRKRDEKIRKLEKKYSRRLEACNRGETAACAEANQISGEITLLRADR